MLALMNDADDIPQLTWFQVIDDFDSTSANGSTCYISGLPKQKGDLHSQPHEIDHFILRAGEIDFEGHMDIRAQVILDTARELGMVSREEADDRVAKAVKKAEKKAAANFKVEADKLEEQLNLLMDLMAGRGFDPEEALAEYADV